MDAADAAFDGNFGFGGVLNTVDQTIGTLADTWMKIQNAKTSVAIEKAKVSLWNTATPTVPQDPNAKVVYPYGQAVGLSTGAMLGMAVVGVVALVLILKD